MRLTWRLVVLFALGMLLFFATALSKVFLWIGIGYDILLLGLTITDSLVCLNPSKSFELKRTMKRLLISTLSG